MNILFVIQYLARHYSFTTSLAVRVRSAAAAVATELYRRRVVVVVGPANGSAWPFWIPRQRNYRLRPVRARRYTHAHTHTQINTRTRTLTHTHQKYTDSRR